MTWFFSPMKPCHYNLILADPPTYWQGYTPFEGSKGPDYATMSDTWLRELPVENLAAADCLLCLWSTMPKLEFSFELMKLWGFRYVTAGAWFKHYRSGKIAHAQGKVLLNGAENFLLGARGRPRYDRRPVLGTYESDIEYDFELAHRWRELDCEALDALRRQHSRKPDDQYARLETLMGDVPRCEIFATQRPPGWDVWGDQVGKYLWEGAAG